MAAICEQVDRLPLAIELAAAQVRVLSLSVLLERLSHRLLLLRGGARDLPERQRTMREAIAWSYDLLTATQQRWFRALGVFMGGCQLSAAEAVCQGEEPIASDEGLPTMAALVNASLVQMETMREGLPRYCMLKVIREYAVEQLRIRGDEGFYQRRHAEYYAALVEEAERVGPGQGSREAHLEQESANGRAALHWAYEQGEVALGLRLATWFGLFWMKRGQMSEGSMWLEKMLALDEAAGAQAAAAHYPRQSPLLRLTPGAAPGEDRPRPRLSARGTGAGQADGRSGRPQQRTGDARFHRAGHRFARGGCYPLH